MTAAIGSLAWRAVRHAASAIRQARDEQVYMREWLLAQQQGGAAGNDRSAQLGSLT
jgi:hypothetical protein